MIARIIPLVVLFLFPVKSNAQAFYSDLKNIDAMLRVQDFTEKTVKQKEIINYGTEINLVKFPDGSRIFLWPNSSIFIENYKYKIDAKNIFRMDFTKGRMAFISGKINKETSLSIPEIGIINVRGTHYEIEIIKGDMFVAVWDGAIDITVDTGTGGQVWPFGQGEEFSFARITEEGEVTQLLDPPESFNQDLSDNEEVNSSNEDKNEVQQCPIGETLSDFEYGECFEEAVCNDLRVSDYSRLSGDIKETEVESLYNAVMGASEFCDVSLFTIAHGLRILAKNQALEGSSFEGELLKRSRELSNEALAYQTKAEEARKSNAEAYPERENPKANDGGGQLDASTNQQQGSNCKSECG